MRNLLLAMLTAGLFVFGWTSCVNGLTAANATPITPIENTEKKNYIGSTTREVMEEMGPPSGKDRCQIELPSGIGEKVLVMGDGAYWHFDGEYKGTYTHYIREMCAVYGTVVVDAISHLERNADGESIIHMEYTDYVLIRKLLEAGPRQDGEHGRYILKPGEIEI